MAIEKMTSREQVLVLMVICIFVGGAYGFLRYMPANKALTSLSKEIETNQLAVKTPKFPDPPEEDVEDLEEKEAALTEELTAAEAILETESQKLSPIDKTQDALLKISEAARANNVKVNDSVPYIVQRVVVVKEDPNAPKLSKKAQKRRDKQLRKQGGAAALAGGAQGTQPKEGELIYQLVNGFDEQRPMQKLNVEGSFKDIQSFIYALSNMPEQVTIVKLDIDVKFQAPAQGIPQPLLAKMIIAI